MEATQVQQQKQEQDNVFKRFLWLYGLYALLNMITFLIGYYLLPEGFMRGSPQLTFATLAASATSLPDRQSHFKAGKYAHHPDGEAHFSQTGKVHTIIRKMSMPLAKAEGHLFTLQFQGLAHFRPADSPRDTAAPSRKRTMIIFDLGNQEPSALKIVGRWYSARTLASRAGAPTLGPLNPTQTPDGQVELAFLLGPPSGFPMQEHVLLLNASPTPPLNPAPVPVLTFIGGFDSPLTITDKARTTTFLCLTYPVSNYSALLDQIGTIDVLEPNLR